MAARAKLQLPCGEQVLVTTPAPSLTPPCSHASSPSPNSALPPPPPDQVFALALHVAPAQLGAALGAELAAPTLPPPAPTPPPPAAAQRPPAASPPSLFIAYASTNLDASFGGGGSLSGATGMLLSALFETDDFALLCAALHRLCPDISLLPPARPISPPAVPPSAAPPVKGFGGGSVDLGERRLRASGLPGQYAGLRVHCVLLCTPAPLATPDGSPSARAHVSLLCRALSAAEGANGAAGAPPLADGALAVLSECGDVIVRLDNKLRVAYVSDAVDELTGYAAHELLGLALSEAGWLLHADDAEQLRAAALDPAHSLAAAAQRAAVLQGRRRPAPVRTRALARLGCKFSTELSLVEMVLTHSFAPAAAETSGALPPCLEAITVCIRERAGAAPAHLFGAPAEPRPAIIAFAGMDIE
ncbi:hypothetical protein T492DRAFT_1132902 [Pavlovales sp. CCMP2436]|nr:hypothetical protein T492DRAFT_1132902 [Pavlovales sp. CCMP2436]